MEYCIIVSAELSVKFIYYTGQYKMSKCFVKNFICNWLVFLLVCFCTGIAKDVSSAEPVQKQQIVRVAFPQAVRLSETHEDGSRSGIIYEWLMEIAKYTHWQYEFITYNDASHMLMELYHPSYDIMGGMLKLPELLDEMEKVWYYPDHLMGFSYSVLLYNKDDVRIKSFDVKTLNNKSIGVFSGAKTKISRLQNILKFNGLNCKLVYYDSSKTYEKGLENKEVDLLLASDAYIKDDYNIALRFPSEPTYIVAKRSDPVLFRQLNEAIKQIYEVNPNFGEELFQKYFPARYENSTNFTASELRFVKESPDIKVATVFKDNYPFYYDVNNQTKGIVPEIFKLFSQKTGLKFDFVEAKSYSNAIDMVKAGQADLFGDFLSYSVIENFDDLITTKNYLSLNSIVLRNKDISLADEDLTEAAVRGVEHSHTIEHGAVKTFSGYSECLAAVNSGKADYTVMPIAVLEHLYMQDYYANIVPVVDKSKLYLSIAMNKNIDKNLYTVLSKGIVNMSEDQLNTVISNSTLSVEARSISIKSLFYSNPVLSAVVIASFVILLGVIFLMHTWFKMQNKIAYTKLKRIEELSKVRSEFLSRMSHEIRTPLNAIIGLTNLMKLSGTINSSAQKNVAKIDSSAKFLLSLVNDVLDMSKIESAKMQIESKPLAMDNMLKQLQNIFQPMAESKNISLQFHCDLIHKYFYGDELRLKQILTNLLSNAYKFTENGGTITVTVAEKVTENDNSEVFFSVRDTGVGIPESDMERIFGSFEQVLSKSRNNQQGTGLGLTISKSLVQLMGGVLKVQSEVGAGSEFFFILTLPVYNGEITEELEDTTLPQEHDLLQGKSILLAEDNALNAEIAVALLEMQGVIVECVENGQQAVERFASQPLGAYDLILMDLQMPVKNGLEAAMEIRALDRADAQKIPIIAMTANTMQEDREKARGVGMNGFIPKPFDVEQLYKSVECFFTEKK